MVSNTNFVKWDLKVAHLGKSNWDTPNHYTAVKYSTHTKYATSLAKRLRTIKQFWTCHYENLDLLSPVILLAACQRFAMVRISDNGPGWK